MGAARSDMAVTPIRRVLGSLKRAAHARLPGTYTRARTALRLSRWIVLRLNPRATPAAAYDDTFWDFHSGGDWAGLADIVIAHLAPRSVTDVGCGQGLLLAALEARGPSIALHGIDSSEHAVRRARGHGLDVALIDLAFLGRRRARSVASLLEGIDLAVCLETAEHLPPWSASALVHLLSRASMVLFSAAPPGQGGTWHINEQPLEYWRERFQREGLEIDPRDEALRAAVGKLDLPWWYAANIHVFSRRKARESR